MQSVKMHFQEYVTLEGTVFDTTPDIAHKIAVFHLYKHIPIRDELGIPLYIRSAYRPISWEKKKGRSGTSQHTFEGLGAVDISTARTSKDEFKKRLELFSMLSNVYTRICYYPKQRFFHCDYKADKLQCFVGSEWQYVSQAEMIKEIKKAL